MDIQISILSVTNETLTNKKGGTYQKLTVAFKGDKGVQGKDIFDFAAKDVYEALVTAKNGEVYTVSMAKEAGRDGKEYWNWKSVTKSNGSVQQQQKTGNTVPTKSTYETPEERAKKQVYIVRQSSITAAIATLSIGSKSALKTGEVIETAKQYEAFVFGNEPVAEQPETMFDEFDQEIPL